MTLIKKVIDYKVERPNKVMAKTYKVTTYYFLFIPVLVIKELQGVN